MAQGAIVTRYFFAAVIGLLALSFCLGTSLAQQAPADPPPAEVQQLLELLKDPAVKSWLEGKPTAPAAAAGTSIDDAMSAWELAVRERVKDLQAAFLRIPQEMRNAATVISRDVNAGQPGFVISILAVLLAVGFGAEWLVRRALGYDRKQGERGRTAAMLPEPIGLVVFALASVGFFLAFDWPPLLQKIVLTLLAAYVSLRIVRMGMWSLLMFSSDDASGAVPAARGADPVAQFWVRRLSLIAGFLLIGWVLASLMPAIGFSPDVARLAAFLFGLGILATAIEAVWRRPGRRRSLALRSSITLYLVFLWLAWVAGLLGLLFLGIYALVLPTLVRRIGNLAHVLMDRPQLTGTFSVLLKVIVVRGALALVIAAAVAWLAYIWRFRAAALIGAEAYTNVMYGLLNGILILLVADLLWHLSKQWIEHRLKLAVEAAGGSEEDVSRRSRLRTLLPIFRNVLAVFIGVVTVMTILSGLGVKIGPLIAGAGIFGVAIGFGSQTLVKDVLSGVFYMLDDAFRVGEYIQSGSYKGTVESFSLRSVRLRHHRGPVYTVPFGELGAVQNMSRDWVIDKMTVKVTYESDIDLARKLIKKIGQELAADPEFAADTLQPLKMQGIDNFGDFAIELRMKLMTKPNAQFPIKRRALMMIKKAFAENGIKIAVPTVHVDGGAEGAAAAQQALKMNQAAELAASQA
jgi:moderate conductance mechanosensitive channel